MRFYAQMADGSTIHTVASKMDTDKDNNMILVYNGDKLVAVIDLSAVIYAHITEKGVLR